MAGVPQFVVTFRGAEVGRYETAERAMTAARSVIDTELASQIGEGDREPGELPRIEWQPPRVHFPFDAFAYWRHRVQSQSRDAKAAASAPPTAAPTSQISLQKLGISGDESVPPRRQDRMQSDRPPVQGGPQQQRRAQLAPPAQQAQSAPPVQQAQRAQPAPMYGGPQWAGPPPQQPPPVHDEPQWAPPPAPAAEEPPAGKRRWFGKKRDHSE